MALTLWKSFNFFTSSTLQLPDADTLSLESTEFSAIRAGHSQLFVGGEDGRVHTLSESFKVHRSWQAHERGRVTQIRQPGTLALLVTVAEDLTHEPELKVWALDQEKKSGIPKCLSTTLIHNGRKQFPISALAILRNLSQVAVGFGNGAITIIRGDLINDRGAKQRTVFESEEPITAVEFRESASPSLYIGTTGRILILTLGGKNQGHPAKTLEDIGCGIGCLTLDESTGDIVVVRDDAVQYFTQHGRGPSIAFEGPKQTVFFFHDRLAILSGPDSSRRSSFTILDTDLKYLAHQELLPGTVRSAFLAWGSIYLVTQEGKVHKYTEKSLQQKLEILYQRDLYILAINLAQKYGADSQQRSIILRKYGDHLHRKGDYDTAMQQYLKAIDSIDPSQVIRKFLDSRRIHNLIEYLEELHEHGKASVDHTTLLLNCYAKLKDTDKLEAFIKSEATFDFDTAIAMCRQGGYFEQAVYLATKHEEHGLVVEILIEESKKYAEALQYISHLEAATAYASLLRYARVLLRQCPSPTTALFCDYYTGRYSPTKDINTAAVTTNAVTNLASFIPLPYRQGTPAIEVPSVSDATPSYEIPQPRTAFSSFVDTSDPFTIFLTALLDWGKLSDTDTRDVKTTLFELYLEKAARSDESSRKGLEQKARDLMEDDGVDSNSILLVSHLTTFREGTRKVEEEQGLLFDIFRSYTSAKDTQGVIDALHKYGPREPQLYPLALAYFTSSRKILDEVGDEFDIILRKIDQERLLSPIQVIQTLSVNDVASVGLVKRYLAANIDKTQKEVSNNRRLIDSYRGESKLKRDELTNLSTEPAVFQTRRCSSCGRSLELPTVHFLCKHSFHQECLNEGDGQKAECPVCAPNNASLRAFRRAQEDMADRHELFADALNQSQDKFGTLAEFFGRGVLSTMDPG